MRRAAVLVTILGALVLPGCASLEPAPAGEEISGRFAIATDLAGRQDHSTGRFQLILAKNALTLDLSSPLGTTVARIQQQAGMARLIIPGETATASIAAADLDALVQRRLGWRLPLAGLPSWIHGRADPEREAHALSGREFLQDGWQITIVQRRADGRPQRLDLSRPAGDDGAPAMAMTLLLDAPGS